MHYVFDLPAPYPLLSIPKLLGVTGGIALCIGTVGLAVLKTMADRNQSDARVWGGEMAFVLLLYCCQSERTGAVCIGRKHLDAWAARISSGGSSRILFADAVFEDGAWFYRLAALVADARDKRS